MRGLLWSVLVVAATVVRAPCVQAQAFADAKAALIDYSKADIEPRRSCGSLEAWHSKELVGLHAEVIPIVESASAYCRITGTLAPEIAFEVSLPPHWNGRFYMIGNGGLAGESLEDPTRVSQRNGALQLGFAFAQTNTGHDARKEAGGTFVLSNPQKAIDYAYLAVHLTAVTAKAITAAYYAKPITRSYWNSCSNGGRQGLVEAQRYPQDFDGLVVNAPWVDQTGYTIGSMWNQKAVSAAGLTSAKLALVSQKVMARCDSLDGLQDGLIDDPRKCDFDARRDVPACPAGADGESCLTVPQAEAIRKVYSGPQSGGKTLFPGYMPGSEAVVRPAFGNAPPGSAWLNFIVPAQADRNPADFNLAENTMRYLVFTPPRPDYDYRSFDFDRDVHLLDRWGKEVNATSTDLSSFRRRGGKLLMTYGWADQVLEPMMGVNYYERAVARNGARTVDFFRLFMVPGMTHCSGGNGTDQFDSMTAMINWVEKGKAPDVLHAARVVDKTVVRTRPLCPYPQVARYSGRGSIDDAADFRCVKP
jgi:Tannase and feruloyl esterase